MTQNITFLTGLIKKMNILKIGTHLIKVKWLINIFFIFLIFSSCATLKITKKSLVIQLEENQDISIQTHFSPFTITKYPSNNLKRIKCINKKNEEVWLYPSINTQFVIITKPDNKKHRIYFDTLILKNDTLYGLPSRIINLPKVFPLIDISKVKIYAEFPRTKKVNK